MAAFPVSLGMLAGAGVLSAEFVVHFVCDGFEPFVRGVFTRYFEGKVRKPTVGGSSMPMFYVGRYVYDVTRMQFYGGFPFLLIPSATGYANEHLASAAGGVVDVPIIAATGFEGDVVERNLFGRYGCQIAVACEVLCVGCVGFAYGKQHFALEGCFAIVACGIVSPYLFGKANAPHALGHPA